MVADGYWPRSVMHLSLPFDDGIADHVVIGEVNDEPVRRIHRISKNQYGNSAT